MKKITKKSKVLGAAALLLLSTSAANLHAEDISAWGKRALKIQNKIDNDAPLTETSWLSTHNSMANNEDDDYWNIAWNQPYGLDNQMSRGVRALGLDVHYDSDALRVCHNNGAMGCITGITGDRLFKYALADIADYISDNPTEVILLKFEMDDSAGGSTGLGLMADEISDQLGDILLRTDGDVITVHGDADGDDIFGGTYLPTDTLTKSRVLAMGANVVIYTGSSTFRHAGLNDMLFYLSSSGYSSIGSLSDMQNISDNNKRNKMYKSMDGSVKSDAGSSGNNDIHPSDTQDWLAAGVNFLEVYGFNGSSAWDIDGESAVSSEDVVWSWDEDNREPDSGTSYARVSSSSDRFRDASGSISYYAACRKLVEGDGTRAYDDWIITSEKVTFDEAEEQCLTDGGGEYFFATPRNKPELDVLINTRNINHSSEDLLLNYEKDSDGVWNADIGEADVGMYDYCEAGGTGTICSHIDSYLDLVGLNTGAEELDPREYASNDYYTWDFRSDGKLQMSNNLWSGDDNPWNLSGGSCFSYLGNQAFGLLSCDETTYKFTFTDEDKLQFKLDSWGGNWNPWDLSGGACFDYQGSGEFGVVSCDDAGGDWRTNDFGQLKWSSNPWGLSNGACFEYEGNGEFDFHGCY